MATGDSYIDQLLGQLKSLFQGSSKPAPTTTAPSLMNLPKGQYQAPIKGNWNSSGGFDGHSTRPNGRKGHAGVDLRAPAGTPIYPMAPGIVTRVGTDPIGGNVVNVQHADNVKTYYAHLSTAKVQKGDRVDNNTVLGTVGDTGNAKGTYPHCHFQVWKDGQLANPANFFNVPKYTALSEEEKKNGPWLSEKAKQDAMAFNMSKHVQEKDNRRMAHQSDLDSLVKVASEFHKLASK